MIRKLTKYFCYKTFFIVLWIFFGEVILNISTNGEIKELSSAVDPLLNFVGFLIQCSSVYVELHIT